MAFVNKRINARCSLAPTFAGMRRRAAKCGPLAVIMVFILFLTTSAVFAQMRSEALWRVENNLPSQPVPLYDGEPSPFPVRQPPPPPEPEDPEVMVNSEPVLTPAQRAAQQRANHAASLMSRIRERLTDNKAFEPDLSSVAVEAIVSGNAGEMALIKEKWKFEGDYIKTDAQTNTRLLELQFNLQQADENLASMVQEEIRERFNKSEPYNLLIKEITPTGVTLRLPNGGSHVISFRSRGW